MMKSCFHVETLLPMGTDLRIDTHFLAEAGLHLDTQRMKRYCGNSDFKFFRFFLIWVIITITTLSESDESSVLVRNLLLHGSVTLVVSGNKLSG